MAKTQLEEINNKIAPQLSKELEFKGTIKFDDKLNMCYIIRVVD